MRTTPAPCRSTILRTVEATTRERAVGHRRRRTSPPEVAPARGTCITIGDVERPSPGRRRSQESHAAILAATRELLDEVGYFRLTVEGVAARAGVGKTTVYRWWPTKGDLVLEAVAERRAGSPPPTGDPRADLRAAMDVTVDVLRSDVTPTLLALAADLMNRTDGSARAVDLLQVGRGGLDGPPDDAPAESTPPGSIDTQLVHDIYTGTLLYRVLSGRSTDDAVHVLIDLLTGARDPNAH